MRGEDDDGGWFRTGVGDFTADGLQSRVDRVAGRVAGLRAAMGEEVDGCFLSRHCGDMALRREVGWG